MAKLSVVGKAHEASASSDFVWFIYASSLDKQAFAEWTAQHNYALPDFAGAFPARLSGFRLAFDVESRFWGGAVASLTEDASGIVEGLALPLPGSARALVEHKEGAISGLYVPFDVLVSPLAGGAPVKALAFRASPDRRLPQDAPPSKRFLETLVRGATSAGLSQTYLDGLKKLLAQAR
ncbi:MAG: gamma-glutamylcyclotransferase [Deltaproteobacteria bacterium]|nr:gamma-glutamylcyclotransferase [Deltaproteobacteria bacterium]